jgi:8-oxo-dGTP pyrophosphatase MutT (NUDIX family)
MRELTPRYIREALSHDPGRKQIEPADEGFLRAGVLVPLIQGESGCDLLFTKRTETVETHKGQISFVGGVMDSTDADIIQTALREANEEIGIPASSVEILSILDDLATPTGFIITPVVGMLESLPALKPNAEEVEEVFHAPLAFFADPRNGRKETRLVRGKYHEIWIFDYDRHVIWGATAMIVRMLLGRLPIL